MYIRRLNKYLAILLSAAMVMTSVGFRNVMTVQASEDEPVIMNTVSGNDPGAGIDIVDESQNDEVDTTIEETEESTEESTEETVSDGDAIATVEPVVVVEEATIAFYVLDDTGVLL